MNNGTFCRARRFPYFLNKTRAGAVNNSCREIGDEKHHLKGTMASARRFFADVLEKIIKARIVRPNKVAIVLEEEHLRRFFEFFAIDCVFDAGANAGQYVEMLRRHVGFRGPIISFEPIPALAQHLREKRRTDRNWFIEEAALDRTVRSTSFNIMTSSEFSSLHAPTDAAVAQFGGNISIKTTMSITTSTLSIQFAKWKQRIGFERPYLKLDTQGNDIAVVEGAVDILTEFVGLQSELAVRRLYSDTPDFREAVSIFESLGFELSTFVPNNASGFPILFETDCIMLNRKYFHRG